MKIHKISMDIFLIIAILTLFISIICLYYRITSFGNFMLGLFASAFIVYIQSFINYKIELSRTLVPFLKEIEISLFKIEFSVSMSLEHTITDYPNNYYEIKNNFEKLNTALFTISDMKFLDKKLKKYINNISENIINLEKEIYLIFTYYDESSKEEQRFLFIHLYKTLKKFNFKYISDTIFKIADKVDFKEYLSKNSFEKNSQLFKKIELNESKKVYIEMIKSQNSIEYKSLKSNFDLFDKNKKKK